MATLKVFRTPIGFHDAYVAAPSQKAALAAWGADVDLFARGAAERVTDPGLIEAPLSRPGEVIRVTRGSDKDHFRELAKARPAPGRKAPEEKTVSPADVAPHSPVKTPQPAKREARVGKPRPSRQALDKVEAELQAEDAAYAARLQDINEQERALKEERARLRADHEARAAKLRARRDKAQADYQQKIEIWAAL